MKDNLIKLLCKAPLGFKTFEDQYYKSTISKVADYLIANDVQIVRHGKSGCEMFYLMVLILVLYVIVILYIMTVQLDMWKF